MKFQACTLRMLFSSILSTFRDKGTLTMSGISYALSAAIPTTIAGIAYGIVKCVQKNSKQNENNNDRLENNNRPEHIKNSNSNNRGNVSVAININRPNIIINNGQPTTQGYYGAVQNPGRFA